jgi:hypothetical protein
MTPQHLQRGPELVTGARTERFKKLRSRTEPQHPATQRETGDHKVRTGSRAG